MSPACPFCDLPAARILAVDGPCLAFRDGFPVSAGHTLVIPRRHVASFRDLTPGEWAAAHRLAIRLAAELQAADPSIAGFNFGANDGETAGQSVFHCHLHLIPRRRPPRPPRRHPRRHPRQSPLLAPLRGNSRLVSGTPVFPRNGK